MDYPYLTCQHPRFIRNFNGERVVVPCGKCDCCKMHKADIYQYLIKSEIDYHLNSYFITLTYDDLNVPKASSSLVDAPLISDAPLTNVLLKSDVQNFIKRLRIITLRDYNKFCKNNNIKDYEKEDIEIRYFAVGEYGPATLRPHYHIVLHSNSKHFRINCNKLLHKAWQFGFIRWRRVRQGRDSVSEYVASYVNSPYLGYENSVRSSFPPFLLHSQFYGEKSLSSLRKEIYKDVLDGNLKDCYTFNKCEISPFTSFKVCSTLFPKCSGFICDDFRTRLGTYRLFEQARNEVKTYSSVYELANIVFTRYIFYTEDAIKYPNLPLLYDNIRHLEQLGYLITIDFIYKCLLTSRYFITYAPYGNYELALHMYDKFYSLVSSYHLKEQLDYECINPYSSPYLIYRNIFSRSVISSNEEFQRQISSTLFRFGFKDKSKKLNNKFNKI